MKPKRSSFTQSEKTEGVDLTAYLTQNRADRVIELRGSQGGAAHFHYGKSEGLSKEN